MDGDKAAKRITGIQIPIDFSEIMYTTESHTAIPLTFFQNRHLRHIIDHAATLPTVKSNPRDGETKGSYILDVTKLTLIFGAELAMDFGQWHEAAANIYRFQMSRDKDGDQGAYAQWWCQHLDFFNNQEDKIVMYDAWKGLKLRLRREYHTQATQYDPHYYVSQYELCKSEYRTEERMKDIIAQVNISTNIRDETARRYPNSNRGGKAPFSRFCQNTGHPFQSSSKRTTLPVCCILCGERGHPVSEHYDDAIPVPMKSSYGKSIWAKIIN